MKTFAILILSTLGFAATAPLSQPQSVPLAGLRLVAEQAAPAGEIAAAGKNANKGGKKTRAPYGGFTRPHLTKGDTYVAACARDLVAVELR